MKKAKAKKLPKLEEPAGDKRNSAHNRLNRILDTYGIKSTSASLSGGRRAAGFWGERCVFLLLVAQSFPVYPVRSPVAHSRTTARGVVGALQRALQNPPKVTGCPDFPRRRTEKIRFGLV
jgi:hypothetical protein